MRFAGEHHAAGDHSSGRPFDEARRGEDQPRTLAIRIHSHGSGARNRRFREKRRYRRFSLRLSGSEGSMMQVGIYGGAGHTAKMVAAELRERGFAPVLG